VHHGSEVEEKTRSFFFPFIILIILLLFFTYLRFNLLFIENFKINPVPVRIKRWNFELACWRVSDKCRNVQYKTKIPKEC